MANYPNRVAFCPLFYVANGGRLEDVGEIKRALNSIETQEDQDSGEPSASNLWNPTIAKKYVRGKCDEAFDCGACTLLVEFIKQKQAEGNHIGWECFDCLKEKSSPSVLRQLPGFYQSSRYRGPPENRVLVEPDSFLDGCTNCGFGSSLLQLVLRKT